MPNKENGIRISIAVLFSAIGIIGTLLIYSFKGGAQVEKVDRHEIRIEKLDTEKLDKEAFKVFKQDIKEDLRILKEDQEKGFKLIIDKIEKL